MSSRKGPQKHYFPIDNAAFEGMLYRYKIPSLDRRVWGWLVRHTWGIRAGDRYQVDRGKVAIALGVHVKSVDAALQSLLKHGAIIRYEEARKGRPAVYGPNKLAESWTYPLEKGVQRPIRSPKKAHPKDQIGEPERLTYFEEKVSHNGSPMPEKGEPERLTYQAENGSPIPAANIDTTRTRSTPKTQILNTDLNTSGGSVEKGFGFSSDPVRLVRTSSEALAWQDVPLQTALTSAEKAYSKRFGLSFSALEREEVSEFLTLTPYRGSLLSFWLRAVEFCHKDRHERKRQPDKARYVAKNPYKDVRKVSADFYSERLAEIEAATAARASPTGCAQTG